MTYKTKMRLRRLHKAQQQYVAGYRALLNPDGTPMLQNGKPVAVPIFKARTIWSRI